MDREGDEYGQRKSTSMATTALAVNRACVMSSERQQPTADKKPNSVYVAVVSWIVCPSAVFSPLRGEAARVETDLTRDCQSVQIIKTSSVNLLSNFGVTG